jgi:hypothetical protein
MLCVYPALSGIGLILLGIYALTTFDTITNIVGIGGLFVGIALFRPKRFKSPHLIEPVVE